MNWDNLRILEAVGRSGSFSGAARLLKINHSSVSRRMRGMEKKYEVLLFEKDSTQLKLTPAGKELYHIATQMAQAVEKSQRSLVNKDSSLKGKIRFTTVDAMGIYLMPHLKEFTETYPDIELKIHLTQTLQNLSRNETDVVLRVTNNPLDSLVGRCVAQHHFMVFGSHALLQQYDNQTAEQLPWVLWNNGFTDKWMSKNYPNAHVACKANTPLGVAEAIKAGIGIGHLPCLAGDRAAELKRVIDSHEPLTAEMWLLTHQDLRNTTRIKIFKQFLYEKLAAQKDIIEGRKPLY